MSNLIFAYIAIVVTALSYSWSVPLEISGNFQYISGPSIFLRLMNEAAVVFIVAVIRWFLR